MTVELSAEEDLERYDDLDEFDDPRFDLRDGGTDLFRAVLVLLIAAAVGALILTRGFSAGDDGSAIGDETETGLESTDAADDTGATGDDPASPEADTTAGSMADGTSGTETDDATTAVTTPATTDTSVTESSLDMSEGSVARDPGQVEVLVLNATDRKGIAAQASEKLQAVDYNTAPAGNATVTGMGSVIYYMEGYRADAIAVAEQFTDGLEGLVQPYDPADPPSDEIGDANVIVVLGIDDAIPIG
jgi:hypothetical protein